MMSLMMSLLCGNVIDVADDVVVVVDMYKGACEGNIHVPHTSSINHTVTPETDDLEAYHGYVSLHSPGQLALEEQCHISS